MPLGPIVGADGTDEADVDTIEVDEDEEGDEVEGRGAKDNDTFGLATLQNSCDKLSAEARSPRHCEDTQPVMSCTNRVALQ